VSAPLDDERGRRDAEPLPSIQVVLDALPIPVFYKDAAGIYRGCNRAFAAYVGRDRGEIVGQPVEGVAPPELARIYRTADEALLAGGGTQVYEGRVRYGDGTEHEVLFNKVAFRDAEGRVAGIIGSLLDLTERRRAEEALLLGEHRAHIRDRLAALGTLAAGVGHQINNPLASLVSNLNFVQTALGDAVDREVSEALGDAMEAAARVTRVVRDLKGFSRSEDALADATAVDLAEVLGAVIRLARAEIERGARLVLDVGELPPVRGSGPRLGQVFLNLLVNAAQSMPPRPREENEVRLTARSVGNRVRVEIRDNGAGLSPDRQARIFDPFVTLDQDGGGAGLSLAICHRIVTGVGGEIEVQGEEGAGTLFRVLLPVAGPPAR
jgi:PAS domain S-box-containing protein